MKQNGSIVKEKVFLHGLYEKITEGADVKEHHYVPGPAGVAAIYEKSATGSYMFYVHADHLGSVDVITNSSGAVVERMAFDPCLPAEALAQAGGQRRNATDWSFSNVAEPVITERGYTMHEHLDLFGLINMNGRTYNPLLARFTGADPIIQSPANMQNFNSYSYVLNNPLMYTDPSGYVTVSDELMAMINGLWDRVPTNGGGFFTFSNGSPDLRSSFIWSGNQVWQGDGTLLEGFEVKHYTKGGHSINKTTANSNTWSNYHHTIISRGEFILFDSRTTTGFFIDNDEFNPIGFYDNNDAWSYRNAGNGGLPAYMQIGTPEWYAYSSGRIDLDYSIEACFIPIGKGLQLAFRGVKYGVKAGSKLIKFAGDEAVQHFSRHGYSVMNALGKRSYNLANYLDDANHVLRNGTYVPEMNGYIKLIGGQGSAKYGFVGLNRATGDITTFHIKTVQELAKKAPSLGITF